MYSLQYITTYAPLATSINWSNLLGQANANRDRPTAICVQFFHLVDSHFKQQHKVGFYAQQLFLSPDHLRQTCKAITGIPPSQFISSRLLTESIKLLSGGSGGAISQIAIEIGFESHSHFCHFFKRHMGVSPLDFRHSLGNRENSLF